jgi:hypothetical protein
MLPAGDDTAGSSGGVDVFSSYRHLRSKGESLLGASGAPLPCMLGADGRLPPIPCAAPLLQATIK